MLQASLIGEWRLIQRIYDTGTNDVALIHRPMFGSTFRARLVGRAVLYLTDQELLDGDWPAVLERGLGRVSHGL